MLQASTGRRAHLWRTKQTGRRSCYQRSGNCAGPPSQMGCPQSPQRLGPIVPQRRMTQSNLTVILLNLFPGMQGLKSLLCQYQQQKQNQPGPDISTSSSKNLSAAAIMERKLGFKTGYILVYYFNFLKGHGQMKLP